MKTFEKNYIGKGKKVADLDIIKTHLKIDDLINFAHTYKGELIISLEIAKLKEPDKFGNEYTIYVNRLVETPEAEPIQQPSPAPRKSRSKKSKEQDPGDLTF